MSRIVLLGPQKGHPTVGATLRALGHRGPVATVTAGWQEWEREDAELRADIGAGAVNLELYERSERVWADDPALRAAHGDMQREVQLLRRLYNKRLASLADDWIDLLAERGPARVVGPERAAALAAIRALDDHHLSRFRELREAYEHRYRPLEHEKVVRERAGIARALAGVDVVVIEGGHVAVLANRLSLFGMSALLEGKTVIACSGASMVLAERVVLFHDAPPWGPGNAEVAMPGLGLHHALVPLPHAHERLRLGDADRVRRLATRLAPAVCAPLGPGSRIDWNGEEWTPVSATRLTDSGRVEPWVAAA